MTDSKSTDCIFCKIINKTIPAYIVYEDDDVISFLDAFPVTRGHTLVVPKKHHATVDELSEATGAKVFNALAKVAKGVKQLEGVTGYNVIQSNGKSAGQTVFHAHFHIIPRKEDDKLITLPASASSMIGKDEALKVKDDITNKMSAAPKLVRQLSERSDTLRQLFKQLDKNNNGKLEKKEFAVCVSQLMGGAVPDMIVDMMLAEADLDASGDIDYDEFVKFLDIKKA